MDTFTDYPNFNHRSGQPESITISTRWKRREWGGWNLVEARTGRLLGWIVRLPLDPKAWECRVHSGAFRGDGIDDLGDIMDEVDPWLFGGRSDGSGNNRVATAADRWNAAHCIVWHLVQRHAPAVGYGRHSMVEMSRWNPKSPTFDATLVGAL